MKTGNVKQVAAFGKLVGICNNLGARYNPSKAALTPTALANLLEQAQQSLEAVTVARTNFVLAINSRQDSYAGVYPLASRIVRALASMESSRENIRDARLLKRKLTSRPPSATTQAATPGVEGSTPASTHSSSQLDYDGQANTIAKLIQLVQELPAYNPNEPDLSVAGLKATLADLRNTSKAVADTGNALASARMHRNQVFYGKGGLLETATAVKEYIRSVFGVRSEPAKELSKLPLAA
jgi:hypothetical protein